MQGPVRPERGARLRAAVLATGLATGLALVPAALASGPAAAVPPFDLPDELVDEQGVLADPQAVRQGQDAYYEETSRQLFVVVVDDLDGWDAAPWLVETARLSGLGEEDLALVVVAGSSTGAADGSGTVTASLRVPEGAGVRPGAVTRTERDIADAAARGDADEVVRAALAGLRAAGVDRPGEATSRTLWWVAVLVLVLAVAGTVVLWLVRRARAETRAASDRQRAEELSGTLGTLVVDLDDAVEEAQLELGLAEARVADDRSAATLQQARELVDEVRAEAVQVHRRRSELSLGSTMNLTWRVPPARAVAELEELHTLASSARERLQGLTLPA